MDRSPHPDAIDLPRFAEVMAYLHQFPAREQGEVLARLGVDARAWASAVAAWSAARDAELARGVTDLTRRFGVAFGRARRRLEAEKPSLASLGRLADPPAAPSPPPYIAPAAPPAQVAPPAPVAPPAVVSPDRRFAGTLPLGTELPIARLPFASAEVPAGPAFEAAHAHAQVAQGPERRAAPLGGTVGVSSAPPECPLPFAMGPRRPASPGYGETVGLPPGVAEAPRVPPGVPDLTLPQYASLRVELQLDAGQAAAILTRYGVAPDGRPPLDAYWRGRFEADPLLRMMFAKAYANYMTWLKASRGGG